MTLVQRPVFLGPCTGDLFPGAVHPQSMSIFADCHSMGGHSIVDTTECSEHKDCTKLQVEEPDGTYSWVLQGELTWRGKTIAIFHRVASDQDGLMQDYFIALTKSLRTRWQLAHYRATIEYSTRHADFAAAELTAYKNSWQMLDEIRAELVK